MIPQYNVKIQTLQSHTQNHPLKFIHTLQSKNQTQNHPLFFKNKKQIVVSFAW